ncbi:hypothetical protein ABZ297_38225 [Nonomuraea sp. NPDC005983]|uniref:hypothetical protein n=1 Tax=Nonomuraea sp. NPDC005983 TaxID=3155595 RepID=UPI0033B44F1C
MMKTRIALVTGGAVLAGVLCGPAALAQAPSIPKGFLLYEKQARKDSKHWYVSENSPNEEVWNIQCSAVRLKGWSARRDVVYDTEIGGGEETNRVRGEQVFVFRDAQGAGKLMARLGKLLDACGKTVKVRKPKIGDQALGASRTIKATKTSPIPQTQKFVAVRKGAAVALYWDMHNKAKSLRSMAQHEADAKKMAAKLCAVGGC